MKTRIIACAIAMAALTGCVGPQISERAAEARPDGQGSVEVLVKGVASDVGTVYGSIYLSTEGFPEDKELAFTYQSAAAASAKDGAIVLDFPSIPAGWFVVAVLHDEDGDEELTVNALGIPKEDYGFSRNPDSVFGTPPFDDAAIFLNPGASERITVTLQ